MESIAHTCEVWEEGKLNGIAHEALGDRSAGVRGGLEADGNGGDRSRYMQASSEKESLKHSVYYVCLKVLIPYETSSYAISHFPSS